MPANKPKDMFTDDFLRHSMRSKRLAHFRRRGGLLPSTVLGIALLLGGSAGCAPDSSRGEGERNSAASSSNELPEITDETIRERINYAFIRDVPEENGAAEPINWSFDENEPKEIAVVDKKMDGTRATIILDIKTRSAPNMRNPRSLAGQIRTEWELKTGWVLRRWEIVNAENISMKYKNLPKPPSPNANQ